MRYFKDKPENDSGANLCRFTFTGYFKDCGRARSGRRTAAQLYRIHKSRKRQTENNENK